MRFLIDENVPRSVADLLSDKGHEVILVTDVLPVGSSDPTVAAYASRHEAIVVTWNRVDFQKLISRRPPANQNQLRHAGLLCISCLETRGRRRIEEVLDLIEYEHGRAQGMRDRRVIIDIGEEHVRILR